MQSEEEIDYNCQPMALNSCPGCSRTPAGGGGGEQQKHSKQVSKFSTGSDDQERLLPVIEINARLQLPEQLPETAESNRKLKLKCKSLFSRSPGYFLNDFFVGRSRLIGKLGSFLDSRNANVSLNVADNNSINSRTAYDKITNNKQTIRTATNASDKFSVGFTRTGSEPLRYKQNQGIDNGNEKQFLSFSSKRKCSSSSNLTTRHRCQLLLGAILNRRKGLNKTSLFLSLLRAPIVLAAIFSLLLFVSLMILYTLTFTHYHHYLQQDHNKLCEQTAEQNKSKLFANEQAAGSNYEHNSDIGGLHLITSRHLLLSKQSKLSEESSKKEEEVEKSASFKRALTVQTECGSFVGSPEEGSILFKGIPYATPPVGFRRWTRPRPIWLDPDLCKPKRVSEMREFRQHCAQVSPMTHRFTGQEDCLYLDIYAARLAPQEVGAPTGDLRERKLPVMVYIHGGFLSFGSSGSGRQADQADQVNWMKAGPSGQLASELGIVLVAFNYRLQSLGFMTLLQLAQNNGPFGSEGNYGLWDQLAALNWIKRNIESFGGDPNNIVLFGPDSASALPLASLSAGFQSLPAEAEALTLDEEPSYIGRSGLPADGKKMMSSMGPAGASLANLTTHQAALDANQIDSVPAPPEVNSASETGKLDTHDLFRAAWLTNPTVYYDLPYELANQHYQRLFLNQSPCFREPQKVSPAAHYDQDDGGSAKKKLEAGENNESLPNMMIRGGQEQTSQHKEAKRENQMLECLMSLSGEQVVRYYLGKDNPSYRLDDQNSLPIHGIFADQFVTLDRELVRRSYPFGVGGSSRRKADRKRRLDENNSEAPRPEATLSAQGIKSPTFKLAKAARPISNNNKNIDDNNAARDDQHYSRGRGEPPASKLNDSNGNYPPPPQPTKSKRFFQQKPTLLLGSTAQAVEYWPCPANLNHWTWQDFKRYTSTSLNSFGPSTYAQAASLYGVPPTSGAANQTGSGPKETYLSMTSDIRQVCPISELAESFNSIWLKSSEEGEEEDQQARVFRYVVEHKPSSPFPVSNLSSGQQETIGGGGSSFNLRPEFAFHNWDLIAFFGFQFEPEFSPDESDKRFQAQIRNLVKEFLFSDSSSFSKSFFFKGEKTPKEEEGQLQTLLLDGQANRKLLSGYKKRQCEMWRRQLGRSYAWVS